MLASVPGEAGRTGAQWMRYCTMVRADTRAEVEAADYLRSLQTGQDYGEECNVPPC
jgi:hypothetical protein